MADIVSSEKRSLMMSGIKGKNTKPELIIRSGLHKAGFRYRIHVKNIPGKPDLFFPKYNAVLFVHGCFWHAHDCHLFKWPSSRQEFWSTKINRNRELDFLTIEKLRAMGLRIGIIWECAIKSKNKRTLQEIFGTLSEWLVSDNLFIEIQGLK